VKEGGTIFVSLPDIAVRFAKQGDRVVDVQRQ
jgi:hypothetical protein